MTNIKQLLDKYQASYVPGEKRSKEYDNMIRQQSTLADNILLLHQLNQELPLTLTLNKCDLKLAETLAKTFTGNLKTLCRNCKKEVIFLTFLFYIKKMDNHLIQLEDYTIFKKYGLNTQLYSLIISRTLKYYMEHTPIPITPTTNYNHEKLIRNGGI